MAGASHTPRRVSAWSCSQVQLSLLSTLIWHTPTPNMAGAALAAFDPPGRLGPARRLKRARPRHGATCMRDTRDTCPCRPEP
eukprot:531531-Prymnesium_polylepis.1